MKRLAWAPIADRLDAMRWFDLRFWAACVVVLSACSDDGVPLVGDAGAGSTSDAGASGSGGSSTPTSAVTTADPNPTSGSDTSDPTDSSGISETASTTTESGSSGFDGSSGTGAGESSGTTTGGTTEPECVVDEDCVLVNDCCSCDAIAVGEEEPACDREVCAVQACTAAGVGMPTVECNFGTCEIEAVPCDPMAVMCDEAPPPCPEGQAPRVVDGCWGVCVPVEFCDVVPSCEACGKDEACVEVVTRFGPSLQCVPIPVSCDGAPSCDCLGEVCEAPFDLCSDRFVPETGSELSCICPAC